MAAKKLRPVHPGDILLHDFMQPLKLSSYRVAKELGVAAPTVNEIVRRRRAITAEMALRLSRYFGTSAQLWQNLQTQYDLEIASKRIGKKGERAIRTHHDAEQGYSRQAPRAVGGRVLRCDPCGLHEIEQCPAEEQRTMNVKDRRPMESTAGDGGPIGRREAAECHQQEEAGHPQIEMALAGTAGDRRLQCATCFHGALPTV